MQALAAQRIDGKKPHVGRFCGHSVDRLGRGFKDFAGKRNAQAIGQGLRQIDRHALGFAGLKVFSCQDGIAKIDGGAQHARGRQSVNDFR